MFGSFLFDHAHRSRPAAALHRRTRTWAASIDRYPCVTTGVDAADNVGDFLVGAKFNLCRSGQQQPAAVAVRGMVKLPTGDKTRVSARADRRLHRLHRQQGSAASGRGRRLRRGTSSAGSPDGFDEPDGVPLGRRAPASRRAVAAAGHGRADGELPFDDTSPLTTPMVGDGRQPRAAISDAPELRRGRRSALTWQHRNGFFLGGGAGLERARGRTATAFRDRRRPVAATSSTGRSGSAITRACALCAAAAAAAAPAAGRRPRPPAEPAADGDRRSAIRARWKSAGPRR